MDYRFRDAAYIAVENVKQSLAELSRDNADSADIKQLSQELERLENELRHAIPY